MNLKVPYLAYHNLLALLGNRPYKEVFQYMVVLNDRILGADGMYEVPASTLNHVIEYVHHNVPHAQAYKLLPELQNSKPGTNQSPQGTVTPSNSQKQ